MCGPTLPIARPLAAPELCCCLSRALSAREGPAAEASGNPAIAGGGWLHLADLLQEAKERLEAAPPLQPPAAGDEALIGPPPAAAPPAGLAAYAEEAAKMARAAAQQAPAKEAEESGDAEGRGEDWTELFAGLLAADVPSRLLACLSELPFEARKDTMRLFAALLRCGAAAPEARAEIVGYVRDRPAILRQLLRGCGCPEAVLVCGQMLRACARHGELVAVLLQEVSAGLELVALTQHASFDVAADAFASLRELLLAHRDVAAAYLEARFTEFFTAYNCMLQADDYVARRQGLRLLGELLLDGSFMNVMLRYVSSDGFLRIHMNLLLDSSPMVQLGAFHVLKIFIACPNKPSRVEQILKRNARRLCLRLEPLPGLRAEDDGLWHDVRAVVAILRALSASEDEGAGSASAFLSGSSGASTPAARAHFSSAGSGASTPTVSDEERMAMSEVPCSVEGAPREPSLLPATAF